MDTSLEPSPQGHAAQLPGYAELHCLSNFSFLRGASHAQELVERAAQLDYAALAITDECSLAGIVRAHVAAKDKRLKLIVGSEFRLEDDLKLVLLAPDRGAYGALASLITTGRRRAAKGAYSLSRADLEPCAASGLLALWVPGNVPAVQDALWIAERFPERTWVAAELHRGADDPLRLDRLRQISSRTGLPLVAAGDVHMHVRSRRRLQDALTAIRLRRPVHDCGLELHPNGERHLRLRSVLARQYPVELLEETTRIAARCNSAWLDDLRYEYPEELVPAGRTPTTHLRILAHEGLARRFPDGAPGSVRAMVEHELALIADLKYEAFFLTVHDVVHFARGQRILCQGRGSAANSAVCYCLGITEINPEEGHALFERFVSRERNEPPDIDVDFEHERREEVIQYIYGKYGRERAALAATVIRYRLRSAVRDLGRALGFGPEECGRLSKSLSWWDGEDVLEERAREAGFDPNDIRMRHLAALAGQLEGFPRHLSQHVGGFVISRGPLAAMVPVENAAMKDRTVIQWDKDDLESLGLLKVDVLALGMLSALRRCLDALDLQGLCEIPPDDAAVYEMICKADTIGVFQIESRAQMSMLPRLKPKEFYDLVIQVAIVRPGPIQGDMVHPYLRRRDGKDPVDYPTDGVRKVLERTLGIPIFQEQVMQLAMVAADFTAGEADQLRRAMAAWKRKGGLEPFEARLKAGMTRNGYKQEFIERIFNQIRGFADYGFPESHSASFALLAYASAWIKCHRPEVFLAALLNSQPMGFYRPSQLVQDARRHGVEVRPADVNRSRWDCTLEDAAPGQQAAVRLGLRMVKGLAESAAGRIADSAPHLSVPDLAQRAGLDRKALKALAEAGALQNLAGHRRNARWIASGVENRPPMNVQAEEPRLEFPPAAEGEEIAADYGSLGLTLGRHPLALIRPALKAMRFSDSETLGRLRHGRRVRAAGLVTCRQRPDTKTGVVFVTLEDEKGWVNVVVWQDLRERQRRELLGAQMLGVAGTIQREGAVVHLVADQLEDLGALLACSLSPFTVDSHDFH